MDSGQLQLNRFEIVQTGLISVTTTLLTGSAGAYTHGLYENFIIHNLGYIPALLAYSTASSTYTLLPYQTFTAGGASIAYWTTISVRVSSTKLWLDIEELIYGAGSIGAQTYNVKYYLLKETAN